MFMEGGTLGPAWCWGMEEETPIWVLVLALLITCFVTWSQDAHFLLGSPFPLTTK